MNHGGLYGRANEQNFPKANDYRNIVVAEAMKVLGFVNRHSRGVLMVQKELKANENGEALLWTSQGLKFVEPRETHRPNVCCQRCWCKRIVEGGNRR